MFFLFSPTFEIQDIIMLNNNDVNKIISGPKRERDDAWILLIYHISKTQKRTESDYNETYTYYGERKRKSSICSSIMWQMCTNLWDNQYDCVCMIVSFFDNR